MDTPDGTPSAPAVGSSTPGPAGATAPAGAPAETTQAETTPAHTTQAEGACAVTAAEPAPETRSARRRRRELRGSVEAPSVEGRFSPMIAGVTVVAGMVIALAGTADPAIIAAVYAALCLVFAWAVPALTEQRPSWPIIVPLGAAGLGVAVAAAVTTQPPYLELGPIALAAATVLACLLQLLRTDGRSGLTRQLSAAGAGLAFIAMGACYLPVVRHPVGADVLWCVIAGIVLSLGADLLSNHQRWRVWLVPLALLLGAGAGGVTALVVGEVVVAAGLLLGLFSGGAAFVVRRLSIAAPEIETVRAQIGIALASTFAPGVVAYVVGRIFIG